MQDDNIVMRFARSWWGKLIIAVALFGMALEVFRRDQPEGFLWILAAVFAVAGLGFVVQGLRQRFSGRGR